MSVSLIGPQSRVENLDLGPTVRRRLRQLMSLCLKTFTRASLLHGHLDSSFRAGYKMSIRPWWEQIQQFNHVSLLSASSSVSYPAESSMVYPFAMQILSG